MTTLSARGSIAFKYAFPFFIVLGACAWTYWDDVRAGRTKPIGVYLAVLLLALGITIFLFRRGPWSKADRVECTDDFIYVRRFRTSETIALTNIKSITWEDRLVTIELLHPGAMGSAIVFYAPGPREAPEIATTLENFAARVRSKRNHVA
jgi:hypothetical protein